MRIDPEIGGCSIILVGSFNPAIFSPDWLIARGIIGNSSPSEIEVGVIHREICAFRVGRFRITVEPLRFSVELNQAPWIEACDLVAKTFGEFLPHTPIEKVGINRQVHFRAGSEEIRNRIGNILAPLEPWGAWGAKIKNSGHELRGGMRSLTMQETWKEDEFSGHLQAEVEPSQKIIEKSGVYVAVNFHAELVTPAPGQGSERIIRFLSERFDSSIRDAEEIIDQIMSLKDQVST